MNDIVKICNNPKTPQDIKNLGIILHKQASTAGGTHIMRKELENFIEGNRNYLT